MENPGDKMNKYSVMGHWRYFGPFMATIFLPAIVLCARLTSYQKFILIPAILYCVPFLALWDMSSTENENTREDWIWSFNNRSVLNLYFLGLPIEEFLCMLVMVIFPIGIWEFISSLAVTPLRAVAIGLVSTVGFIVFAKIIVKSRI